ncbi:hypothetical protein BU23DRAFT_569425 [Bimuria novae-zelandiae CBS 107.79]|uniref:Uncharacterized protein n=1 Tax=Bimuria novae-zelandiae CBS 107.79 TaxID=1447943 RepID=A0A6A5VA70_9PLEO|nr:hypothetical protein BU23DRAFT_569425 [Bimuria novae-zelandiae CBS 107.79]
MVSISFLPSAPRVAPIVAHGEVITSTVSIAKTLSSRSSRDESFIARGRLLNLVQRPLRLWDDGRLDAQSRYGRCYRWQCWHCRDGSTRRTSVGAEILGIYGGQERRLGAKERNNSSIYPGRYFGVRLHAERVHLGSVTSMTAETNMAMQKAVSDSLWHAIVRVGRQIKVRPLLTRPCEVSREEKSSGVT